MMTVKMEGVDRSQLSEEAIVVESSGDQTSSFKKFEIDQSGLSINQATLDAWEAITTALCATEVTKATYEASSDDLEPGEDLGDLNVVVGAGIGFGSHIMGIPGDANLVLYAAEPIARQTTIDRAMAVSSDAADALRSEEANVEVVTTGPIDLLSHRFRKRPAPSGISIGHGDVTAGTFGCLCTGRKEPRNKRCLILSNNHVLANTNRGKVNDPIYQPGPYDGGKIGQNIIAHLERFVPINTVGANAVNYVDCATAWADPNNVNSQLMYFSNNQWNYFKLSGKTKRAAIGMRIGKSGRTTQLTSGIVVAVGVTIRVNMGDGKVAAFDDQIAIRGLEDTFSRGGDSGSTVWTWNKERNPVGLLFAGGAYNNNATTFANPIGHVLNALDVDLVV